MLCIGLTGGIGSGKSTVADFFSEHGIDIIDADIIARQITEPGTPALKNIADRFGAKIVNPDGSMNRKQLRHIVFNDEAERLWLESLLHPMIRQKMAEAIRHSSSPYCIAVIPLLAKAKSIDYIDRVLVIDTPKELQIQRAKERDQASEAHIQAIIDSQSDRKAKLLMADDVIINNSSLGNLKEKVDKLHQEYLGLVNS